MTAEPPPDPRAVQTKAEWAAGLTVFRVRADLSIRELARRTHIPHATLGGYFSGRNLPQAGQVSTLTTVLVELGICSTELDDWIEATHRVRAKASAASTQRPESPYPGLASFDVDDSAVFFGRTDETADVLARLRAFGADPGPSGGMLAVVGPSGSGKSSLLRAGVAASLARSHAVDPWTCAVMNPGARPHDALADALGRLGAGTRVLVVDQFEEVFTAVDDPAERTQFLDDLAELATADPPTSVVLGMRADFYTAAAREPRLVPVLQHAQIVLGPLGPDALRQAVVGPAEAVRVDVEDGLVDLVLADAAPRGAADHAHDAGALPLLSHALLSAWQHGSGRTLTVADYRAAGGVDGAVQRTAEDAYAALDDEGRGVARGLFLRLVHISDDVTVTRRTLAGAELDALQDDDTTSVRTVVDAFVDRRLLTTGTVARANSLEISHEALLSAWPRLREWIDTDRAALRLHRTVTEAANAWQQSGRDETLLLRGGRLEAATEMAGSPSRRTELNHLERTYVSAGVAALDVARLRSRRRTRRLRRLLASVAVLALVAAGLAAYSLRARSEAESAERAAKSSRDDALSRQIAIEARQLADRDPALAQQLAVASYRISPTAEARSVLTDFSARPTVTRLLGTPGRTPMAMSSKAARLAAVGQASGAVRLVRVTGTRPQVVTTLPSSSGRPVTAVAFSPDSRTLFVADRIGLLDTWDVSRPSAPRRLASTDLGTGFTPAALSVAPSGETLLVGGSGRTPLQRWSVADPSRPTRVNAPAGLPADIELYALARSADGRYLAAGGDSSYAYVWDTTRPGTLPIRRKTGANRQLAVLFGGGRLYVGDSEGATTALDPATGRVLGVAKVTGAGWAQTLTLSSDGGTIGVGSDDSTFRQFSTTTFALRDARTTPKEVVSAAYLPGGAGVVLSCVDGATYVVPRVGNQVPTPATTYNLFFDRTGDRLLASTGGGGGGARVWDVRGSTPKPVTPFIRMTSTEDPATGGGSLSPDGHLVAVNNFVGQVQLFDIRDPARPRPWGEPFQAADELVESLSMSPRGRLLAMGSDDGSVSVWDVSRPASPTVLSRLRGAGAFYDVAWNHDATLIAAASADPAVYLWSVADPRHPVRLARLKLSADDGGGVTFSHDGHLLAATGSDGRTRIWNIDDPRHPRAVGRPLVGPTDYTNGASFNPDDSLLAVSSADSTVRIYDVHSPLRTPVVTLEDIGGPVYSTQFSPDGTRLVASGRTDSAPVWTVDPTAAADELCARGGTVITRAEWARHVPGAAYAPPCR